MVKQSGGKLTSAISTTRALNASLQAHAKFTEIRFRTPLSLQYLQFGTQSLFQVNFKRNRAALSQNGAVFARNEGLPHCPYKEESEFT